MIRVHQCNMLSRKDLTSAELDTVRVSGHPTTVITASGSIETNEGATVYVQDLDLFLTVLLLEDTPAVLSLGKHGYSHEWKGGQPPNLKENGRK